MKNLRECLLWALEAMYIVLEVDTASIIKANNCQPLSCPLLDVASREILCHVFAVVRKELCCLFSQSPDLTARQTHLA